MIKLIDILFEKKLIKEYSNKLISDLTIKFKQEKPNLNAHIIQAYINRFSQIKDNPKVLEKDINKYTWKELETVVDANQSKRIKAGKINDGEPSNDANLVYNQNKLRIYVGKTKQACIKYGNGYSFCISARGEDSMYSSYRFEEKGTPYFVFDDTKTSEKDENGNFIDPTHLLVIFIFGSEIENKEEYTVTTADNSREDKYYDFIYIEKKYPRLKGLEKIFQPVEADPKESSEYEIEKKYDSELNDIGNKFNEQTYYNSRYLIFGSIKGAKNSIDDLLNNKAEIYEFYGKVKPEVKHSDYSFTQINQLRIIKKGNIKLSYDGFIKDVIMYSYDGYDNNHNIVDDWIITYKKIDNTEDPQYKEYLKDVKQLVDRYRNESSKLKLMKENLVSDDDIDEYDVVNEQDIKEFAQFIREYTQMINEADCSCITEAEYHGRTVKLGKIMQGDIKKFKVYVKNNKGKVVKVNFGFGGKSAHGKRMNIKVKNPKRRAAYRARHHCDNPGPRWKANFWSCRKW